MAIGLQSIIIRLIGSIPGPVLFGYFIDRTCLLWEPTCGEKRSWDNIFLILIISDASGQGSCLLYDNYQFSLFMFSCCLMAKVASLLTFIASGLASRRSDIPDLTTAKEVVRTEGEAHDNSGYRADEPGVRS